MFGWVRAKKYWGGVYEFEGYDHYALVRRDMFGNLAPRIKIVWLYVGQTRQKFEARWKEHEFGSRHWKAAPKEWFDLVTRKHKAISGQFVQTKLDKAELGRIHYRATQYNVKGNENNPHRIKPGKDHETWKAQRAERDALGGTEYLVRLAKQQARQGKWYLRWLAPKTMAQIKLQPNDETWQPVAAHGPALEGLTQIERLEQRWNTEEARQ